MTWLSDEDLGLIDEIGEVASEWLDDFVKKHGRRLLMDNNPISKEYPLVMIEWLDSRRPTSEWEFLKNFKPHDPVKCVSVGWLISDGKVKELSQNMADTHNAEEWQISGVIHIPEGCVVKITDLGRYEIELMPWFTYDNGKVELVQKETTEQGNGTTDKKDDRVSPAQGNYDRINKIDDGIYNL